MVGASWAWMQQGGKNRWPLSAGKAVTMGRAAVNQREAGWAVPVMGREWGGERVAVALLSWNMPLHLLLHQLGRGQCQRASRGIGKISQDWP